MKTINVGALAIARSDAITGSTPSADPAATPSSAVRLNTESARRVSSSVVSLVRNRPIARRPVLHLGWTGLSPFPAVRR